MNFHFVLTSFLRFSAISSMPSSVIFEQPDRERMVRFGREWTRRYACQDQGECTECTERWQDENKGEGWEDSQVREGVYWEIGSSGSRGEKVYWSYWEDEKEEKVGNESMITEDWEYETGWRKKWRRLRQGEGKMTAPILTSPWLVSIPR